MQGRTDLRGFATATRLLPPRDPTANDRALYAYFGGIQLHGGDYIGADPDELDAWLAGRRPRGILTAIEDDDPAHLENAPENGTAE